MTTTATKFKAAGNYRPTEQDMAAEYGVDVFNSAVYVEHAAPANDEELIDAWLANFGPLTGEIMESKTGVDGALETAWYTAVMHERFLYEQARQVEREIHSLLHEEREARKCPKCNGTGYLAQYAHWHNGECFKCNGTGQKGMADLLRADQ